METRRNLLDRLSHLALSSLAPHSAPSVIPCGG
jgi:hypothetical protein